MTWFRQSSEKISIQISFQGQWLLVKIIELNQFKTTLSNIIFCLSVMSSLWRWWYFQRVTRFIFFTYFTSPVLLHYCPCPVASDLVCVSNLVFRFWTQDDLFSVVFSLVYLEVCAFREAFSANRAVRIRASLGPHTTTTPRNYTHWMYAVLYWIERNAVSCHGISDDLAHYAVRNHIHTRTKWSSVD